MVEREREHATGLRDEAGGAAGNVRRTPVTLPGQLPFLELKHEVVRRHRTDRVGGADRAVRERKSRS